MTEFPVDAQALTTIMGVAAVIMGLTQIIKPAIELRYGIIGDEPIDPVTKQYYSATLNLISLGIGIFLSLGGYLVTTPAATPDGIVSALMVGLGGTLIAIGAYEPASNATGIVRTFLSRE